MNKDILNLLKPPVDIVPTELGEDWESKLPEGYIDFLSVYGPGCIDNFLWIMSPISSNENLNLNTQTKFFRDNFNFLAEEFETFRPPNFPDVTKLFCLGVTDNGDYLCGSRHSDVSYIYVIHSRAPDYFEYMIAFDQFIVDLLKRKIVCNIFPTSFPSSRVHYTQ